MNAAVGTVAPNGDRLSRTNRSLRRQTPTPTLHYSVRKMALSLHLKYEFRLMQIRRSQRALQAVVPRDMRAHACTQ
jgi:hypothetical protein